MLSIVMGIVAICLGIWGLTKYWWYMVEMVTALFPLVLILGGAIAVLAGIRNTGLTAIVKEGNKGKAEQVSERKKDE